MRRRVVTFTGGLGAQIVSAAVYFAAENVGEPFLADLSYFDQTPRVALPGSGKVSIWPWHLHLYGLPAERFKCRGRLRFGDKVLRDGPIKLGMALAALGRPEIRSQFPAPQPLAQDLRNLVQDAVVIHLRRGDYLNVASHIVSDADIASVLPQLAQFSSRLVLVTDGDPSPELIEACRTTFPSVTQPSLGWREAHVAMRLAKVLVTSNSQFSLTAGLLREQGLTITPDRWFGPSEAPLEREMAGLSHFRLLTPRLSNDPDVIS